MGIWASSEFCRYYTEKTSPVTLTAFLINPLGNFPHTHIHTYIVHTHIHTHGFIEIIIVITVLASTTVAFIHFILLILYPLYYFLPSFIIYPHLLFSPIYYLPVPSFTIYYLDAHATSVQSLHVRERLEFCSFMISIKFCFYYFPRQLNGIIHEFNANLNEFKVTYSVNDTYLGYLGEIRRFLYWVIE